MRVTQFMNPGNALPGRHDDGGVAQGCALGLSLPRAEGVARAIGA